MSQRQESGNVIIFIFIAIVLMGALVFAISSGNRDASGTLTDAQANAYATDILAYSTEIKQTIKRLTLSDCSDTEISFDNPFRGGYVNSNSPSDERCHIFSKNGGGLTWQIPDVNGTNTNHANYSNYVGYHFTGHNEVVGIGTDCGGENCADLTMVIAFLKRDVCMKINDKLGINNPDDNSPDTGNVDATSTPSRFDGDYDSTPNLIGDVGADEITLVGESAACVYETDGQSQYTYYTVILSR